MNKDNNIQDKIDKSISIADIPATLAMEANEQWKTVRHVRLVERLTEYRVQVEAEAGVAVANIETTFGLALADITEALGIEDPDDLLRVLGGDTYLQIYTRPIPYELTEQQKVAQEHRAAPKLLAKLQERCNWITAIWKARAKAKLKAEPSPPITA